jgi:hypothetical protein
MWSLDNSSIEETYYECYQHQEDLFERGCRIGTIQSRGEPEEIP